MFYMLIYTVLVTSLISPTTMIPKLAGLHHGNADEASFATIYITPPNQFGGNSQPITDKQTVIHFIFHFIRRGHWHWWLRLFVQMAMFHLFWTMRAR